MPMLSLQFYLAAIIIASAAMLFGLRQFGSARGIARFRDVTISGALGYGILLVSLYQGIAFYNAPTAVFFRWAVQGAAFLAFAGFAFQQLGRHVGTRATRKLFRSMPVSAALGILLIITYATVAIFADVIAPFGQSEIFANSNVLPGGNPDMGGDPAHILGTDQIGRDILSRLIFGAQNTVGIAFVTTLLAFFIGISLGFLAATIGGVLDQVLSRIVDMLMSIPQLIFALLLMTIATTWFGSQKTVITLMMILIIAVLDSTRVFRLSRAVGMNIVVMDFFEAAKLRGEKMSYLIFRETVSPLQGLGVAVSLAGAVWIVARGDPLVLATLTLNYCESLAGESRQRGDRLVQRNKQIRDGRSQRFPMTTSAFAATVLFGSMIRERPSTAGAGNGNGG